VDIFLSQPLLPAPLATVCARNEDTKESGDFEECKASWKTAISEGTW
jgi:hypothetical protein